MPICPACPPEDCGGPHGYANLLEIVADPRHPDHVEMSEWLGDFDLAKHAKWVSGCIRAKKSRAGKPSAG